jgi:hypothetical protein
MKMLLAVSLVANAVFVTGLLWKGVNVDAEVMGAGGGTPLGNGDVNGDGRYDVSDAVSFLQWRYLGGPAPVAIECPLPAVKRLPATGQTRCYDSVYPGNNEISCASADFPGQDGAYQAGCPTEGRFQDNGDGTVTDNCTGLMWQKDTADWNGDGTISPIDQFSWQDALKYCEGLDLVGHDDWRLPNIRELQSIVDYGQAGESVDPVFRAESELYWSSSTRFNIAGMAWGVDFSVGDIRNSAYKQSEYGYVRAVRGGL